MKNQIKAQQRRLAYAARESCPDKDTLSRTICRRFMTLAAYGDAQTVMGYLHCRSEVRTVETLRQQLNGGKTWVIPYCTEDRDGSPKLGLWRLLDLNELAPGVWGILEPPPHIRNDKRREVSPEQLDLIMVPGVAFDRSGGRLGNGVGYYDRLLHRVREDCIIAGVCYEAQLLPEIAMQPHDIFMDVIITENDVYPGKGR